MGRMEYVLHYQTNLPFPIPIPYLTLRILSNRWGTLGTSAPLQDLEKFLMEIRRSGFTLNFVKSNFAVAQVKFVGHIIGSGYREPDPDKLAAVKNLSPPVDKRQIRQVIGLFSYFREYMPDFAKYAYTLSELTKRGVTGNHQL